MVLAVLLSGILVGLGTWWTACIQDGRVGNAGLVMRSEAHHGEQVVLTLARVVDVQGPDRWRVAEGDLHLDVLGPSLGRREGEELTVIGRWDAQQHAIVAQEVHPAPGRNAKKLLGIAGLVALAWMLPHWVRPGPGGLVLRG